MSQLQYIGARYVPIWYHNSVDDSSLWEVNVEYEPLTYVTTQNNHLYLSKKTVPDNVGTPAQNTDYWLDMGVFTPGGSISDLEDRVTAVEGNIVTINGQISDITGDIADITAELGREKKMMLIADSYGMNPRAAQHWTDIIEGIYTNTISKSTSSIGFTTVAQGNPDFNFLGKLKEFKAELTEEQRAAITDIIVCGGWNDAREVTQNSMDPSTTLITAIRAFVDYAEEWFPNATPHIGFIGWQSYDEVQHETTMADLNSVCQIYENSRYKNLHVLNGVADIMKNCEFMDSSYFHPNDAGGSALAQGILRAMYGGYTYSRKRTISNSDVDWAGNRTGTIEGTISTNGTTAKIHFIVTNLNADFSSGSNHLLAFKPGVLPYGHNLDIRVNGIDYAHNVPLYGIMEESRFFDIYPKATAGNTYSGGILFFDIIIDTKYEN